MPLRLLNRYLRTVPGFHSTINLVVQLTPAILVILSLFYRGIVLIHHGTAFPHGFHNDAPVWVTSELIGRIEIAVATVMIAAAIFVRTATDREKSTSVLRVVQFGFFIVLFYSGGLIGVMDKGEPAISGMILRAILSGLVVLQLCSEIEYLCGVERRYCQRRHPELRTERLSGMSNIELKDRYLEFCVAPMTQKVYRL